MKINNITTEGRNKNTLDIDIVSTVDMVKMINNEDKQVALIVETQIKNIALAIDAGYLALKKGGRIIYFGAGTSGRLGVLDASEIFPTFGEKDLFIGLIAGGDKALRFPIEAAEDNEEFIIGDFKKIKANKNDFFVGLAASGRTPYVINGLKYANQIGATTVSIATSANAKISNLAKISIEASVGPEAITGSTRMKSGTAQKMILNQLSTGIMVKLGKTYSNMMVDMKPTNEKLVQRALNMIQKLAKIDDLEIVKKLFLDSAKNVKVALVMYEKNISKNEAIQLLEANENKIRKILNN